MKNYPNAANNCRAGLINGRDIETSVDIVLAGPRGCLRSIASMTLVQTRGHGRVFAPIVGTSGSKRDQEKKTGWTRKIFTENGAH